MSDEIQNIMPKFLVSAPKFLMTLTISFCVFFLQFLLEILKAKYPDIYDKLYFSDPNWKISADNLSISNIKTLDPAKELINIVKLPPE